MNRTIVLMDEARERFRAMPLDELRSMLEQSERQMRARIEFYDAVGLTITIPGEADRLATEMVVQTIAHEVLEERDAAASGTEPPEHRQSTEGGNP